MDGEIADSNSKLDIIRGLFEMNLSHLCYDIFSQLDTRSFANSRLVSKTWKDFIDFEFDKPKGRKWMQENLQQNYLDKNFFPKVNYAKIHPNLREDRILIDKEGICVMNDVSGEIHMYDNHSQKLKWKRNFSSYTVNPMKIKLMRKRWSNENLNQGRLNGIDLTEQNYFEEIGHMNRTVFNYVEMNEERIFALIDKQKLFFICRKTGQILHRMDQRMEKFGQYDNKYLYALVPLNPDRICLDFELQVIAEDQDYPGLADFKILFYDISPKISPIQIFANESDQKICCWYYDGHGGTTSMKEDKIVGIHCDKEVESYYLVSWNITSGKEIFRVWMMNVIIDLPPYGPRTLESYLVDNYFYLEFVWDGILKWPYVGFNLHPLNYEPYVSFDGTFIIDATTGVGKLFDSHERENDYHPTIDIRIQMDIAMIHFQFHYLRKKDKKRAIKFCFVELNKYLDHELEHKSVRSLFVEYPDYFNITAIKSQIGFTNGKILILVLEDERGIYLAKLNFWS